MKAYFLEESASTFVEPWKYLGELYFVCFECGVPSLVNVGRRAMPVKRLPHLRGEKSQSSLPLYQFIGGMGVSIYSSVTLRDCAAPVPCLLYPFPWFGGT
jgi:hypothetical protein